jgi:hypothetical protein
MTRPAKKSEQEVFNAIMTMEAEDKISNPGALKLYFDNTGCVVRYDRLITKYFLNKEAEERKAKQLEVARLPEHISAIVEKAIASQAENYREDVLRAFNAAFDIGSQKLDEMKLLIKEQEKRHAAVKQDFLTSSTKDAEIISMLSEKLEMANKTISLNESEVEKWRDKTDGLLESFIKLGGAV